LSPGLHSAIRSSRPSGTGRRRILERPRRQIRRRQSAPHGCRHRQNSRPERRPNRRREIETRRVLSGRTGPRLEPDEPLLSAIPGGPGRREEVRVRAHLRSSVDSNRTLRSPVRGRAAEFLSGQRFDRGEGLEADPAPPPPESLSRQNVDVRQEETVETSDALRRRLRRRNLLDLAVECLSKLRRFRRVGRRRETQRREFRRRRPV